MKTVLIHYLELLFIERDNPDRRQEAIQAIGELLNIAESFF
jgi:hypothetical protein